MNDASLRTVSCYKLQNEQMVIVFTKDCTVEVFSSISYVIVTENIPVHVWPAGVTPYMEGGMESLEAFLMLKQ